MPDLRLAINPRLREYAWRVFHVLLRRWWVLVACAVGAAAIALVVTELRPAPYVSSAYVAVPVGATADIGDRNAQAFAIAPLLARRSRRR